MFGGNKNNNSNTIGSKDSLLSWIVTTNNNGGAAAVEDTEVGLRSSIAAVNRAAEDTDDSSTAPMSTTEGENKTATTTYGCQPYKVEILDQQLIGNSPGAGRRVAVIETLRQMGIQVFVIDAKNTETAQETVEHIKRVVNFATRENSLQHNHQGSGGYQRCLFFQDEQGRLFNLMLSRHVTGPVGTWKQYMDSFSGREAMMALTVLCRSIPCVAHGECGREAATTTTMSAELLLCGCVPFLSCFSRTFSHPIMLPLLPQQQQSTWSKILNPPISLSFSGSS